MTYIPGSGGGAGNISTSGDVALNNPSSGDVLSYDKSLDKWKNAIPSIADASVTQKGGVQLSGDLAGTATNPTVPAIAALLQRITALEQAVSQLDPQAAPASPVLTAVAGDRRATLSWTISDGALDYQLRRDDVVIYSDSGTTYIDTGLVNDTAVTYTVTAVNNTGSSPPSAAVTVTPHAETANTSPNELLDTTYATGWNVRQGVGVAVTTPLYSGTSVTYKVTSSSGQVQVLSDKYAVSPGQTVTLTGHARPDSVGRYSQISIGWYDSAGAWLHNVNGHGTTTAVGSWKPYEHTATAPAGAAFFDWQIFFNDTLANEVHYIGAASAKITADATTTDPAPTTRDVYKWPFAVDSIWNTPIGSGAVYVPSGLLAANAASSAVTSDNEYIGVNPSDPLKTPSGPFVPGGTLVHVPTNMSANGSWNSCAVLLDQDNRSVWQGQPMTLSAGGNPSWRYTFPSTKVDLYGDGRAGIHGGSGLSAIGGSIRLGELTSTEPLRHVLKMNTYGKRFLSQSNNGHRWPAYRADSYYNSGSNAYGGTVVAMRMGSLVALRPDVNLSSITEPRARKIAECLRDYGAYIVDDTAWDVHAFCVEKGVWPARTETAFHSQLMQVITWLYVIDNNSPTSVGGGGTRRAPLAPAL